MIVSPRFEGDDLALAGQQHDCYGDALYIIRSVVERRYRAACHLLGQPIPNDRWPGKADHLDHRDIQPLHDFLAAVWRHRVRPAEPVLACISPASDAAMPAWLSWLRTEMKDWCDDDHEAVRLWVEIQQQHGQPGADAGDILLARLIDRHADVRWLHSGPAVG